MMRNTMQSGMRIVAAVGLAGLALAGCRIDEDIEAAQGSTASTESTAELSTVASTFSDPLANVTVEDDEDVDAYMTAASTEIQTSLESAFAGCVTAYPDDTDPSTIGATFDCEGTNGMVSLTGTIAGEMTPVLENRKIVGVQIALETEDMGASDRAIVGTIDIYYTFATGRAGVDMDFTADDSRVGVVDVLLSGEVAVHTSCVYFDGNILATNDNFELDILVSDFERCEGSCPSAGGSADVDVVDARGEASLLIEFNGGETAQVSSSRGRTFDVELQCAREGDADVE